MQDCIGKDTQGGLFSSELLFLLRFFIAYIINLIIYTIIPAKKHHIHIVCNNPVNLLVL